MRFSPKSREELETMNLLKPGVYQFRVANAKDKTSKSGNDMIELTLDVYDDEGKTTSLFDYLLEAMPVKLFAFCESTGMEQLYHSGSLTSEDCINKNAYVELIVKKGTPNPQGGDYPDKNEVKRYMSKPSKKKEAPAELLNTSITNKNDDSDIDFDDQVPF